MPTGWSRWASAATSPRIGCAFAFMQSRDAVKKLFDEIAPRFKDRPGGYTRVVKYGVRRGDAAPISIIEFTGTSEDRSAAQEAAQDRDPRASAGERRAAAAAGRIAGRGFARNRRLASGPVLIVPFL